MDDRSNEPGGEAVFERCFCGEECPKDELCLCLSKKIFCGEFCPCQNCWNNGENETEVVQLRKEIKTRKALAHSSTPALLQDLNEAPDSSTESRSSSKLPVGPIEVGPSEETQTDFQIQKCSCDNKQCSNNGCECYFLAVKCNESCACNEDCLNKQ